MGLGELLFSGKKSQCDLHDGHAKKANRTLLIMVAVCFSLIVWHVWVYGTSNHLSTGNAATPLALLVGYEIWDLLFNAHGIAAELWDVFPYFIVGILVAGYLRTFKIAVKLQNSLKKYGALSIVVASVVGIITPLCACGTITTAVSLLFAGIPLAPVMSLMTTSALLSPSTYLITLNDLGSEWTVIRTISALAMGLFAGGVTLILSKRGFEKGGLFVEGAVVPGDFHDEDYPIEHLRCNCREKFGNRIAIRTGNKFLVFLAKSAEMFWTVGKYILVGVAIGAIVERYMPSDWIYRFFGQKSSLNIIWITLASVPLFLHQISASSILSHIKNTLDGTLDGGAALAFMIGGPVTAIPTMILFWTIFKKKVFFLYMFVCLVGTILIASLFQWFIFIPGVDTGNKLFTSVSSLGGGTSSTIHKTGKNVRVAVDSGGKNIIATYSDELATKGSVLFDGGFARFEAAAKGNKNDGRYIINSANWLEQNSTSPSGKKIVIYTAAANNVDIQIVAERVATLLKSASYDVSLVSRSSTPYITEKMLADMGQLWLLFPESGDRQLNENEIKVISSFNERGNGMLIVPNISQTISTKALAINRLTEKYGVQFVGVVESQPRIEIAITSQFFTTASEMLGKFLKIVHKA